MGPAASKDTQQLQQLHNRFQVVREAPDSNVSFLEEKETHRPYLLKEITFNDREEFNRAISKVTIKKRELEGQPHVAPLAQYFTKTEDNFCSNFYKLYVLFEYPHKTLRDEIDDRQKRNSKFQQKELWSILASCILGLCHLQNADIKHQTLRSDTILLTADGAILVADPFCMSQSTNYETLVNKRSTSHVYLSPEQCLALHEEKLNPININPFKSDVFTMGMIMLQAGLLNFQDDCYREDGSQVHWETLQYNLEKFGQAYSHELKAMLEMMLNQNEDERLVWVELETYVRSGEESESMERIQTPVAVNSQPQTGGKVQQQENNVRPYDSGSAPAVAVASSSGVASSQPPKGGYRQLGGGGANHQTVSQFQQPTTQPTTQPMNHSIPVPQPSDPTVGRMAQTAAPTHYLTNTQAIIRSQVAQQQQIPDLVVPNQPSIGSRPQFNQQLPVSSYTTTTKIDENLVEIDEEDLTQTREPDDARQTLPNSQANFLNQTSNFNETATIRQTYQAAPSTHSSGVMFVSAPPMHQSGYQITSIPTFQLLQQPTEAQKFVTWQSSIPPVAPTGYLTQAPPQMTFQSTPPLNLSSGGMPPNGLAGTFRPASMVPSPVPVPVIQPTYQAPMNYQPSYAPPINYSSIPAPTHTNYPPTSFSSRPAAFDYGGTRIPGQTQFSNYQTTKMNDIPTAQNQQRLNNARFTESFDAASTNRALNNEAEIQFVKETFKQGSYYQGQKVNGMRHGTGKFYYTDGGLYDGEWRENKMSGHGKLYYQSGKIAYDGNWSDDKFTGFGVLYNEVPLPMESTLDYSNFEQVDEYWTRFEGQFYDDLKQGPGRLYLSNGQYFEGEFDKDTATGPGCYHRLNGENVHGLWNQNMFVRRLS